MKTSVDIRLAESVVFLRAGDATGRFRNPLGEPPAMLRGILVLNLAKATKITSIEVQLMCKASTAWPEGVGARRIDIQEEHKIYSQSYVYFDANATSSATSHRRTLSVGPGIAFDLDHDDEDRSDESSSDNHDARRTSRTSQSQSRDEPEWERRGRGLIRTNTRGRLPQRHLSVDQMNHQTEYVAHHDTHLPTPPYSPRDSPSLTPVRSLSRRTSFSLHRSPMDTVEELQETNATGIEDLPNVLQGNLHLDSESSLPPSRNSLQLPVTAGLQTPPYQPEHPPSIPSSIEHSGEFVLGNSSGTVYSNPYNHTTISIPNGYFPSSPSRATSTRATSPTAEDAHSRGRKSKRFNFANVSTAFFDAVKDRVRSVSHNERDRDVGSMRARERDRLEGHRDVTTITSARDMTPIRDMPPLREMTPLRDATPGRSHTRDSSRGRRRSPDRRRVSIAETIEQPHKSAILERVGEVLGLDIDDKKPHGDGWKEFKSGVYTYPISFAIPVTSSPSMSCEYGSVVWRLKAVVHRPGTFKSKLSASQEVTVVACPGEDDTEDTESIIVERQWDDQMQYLISISGRSFFIGGTIPINLTFAPWTKMKVYKLSLVIEERVEYLTQFKRVARTDSVNRIPLLSLTPAAKENYLLPLSMDDPDALKNSPLNQLFQDDDDLSEIASSYMGPGPWHIETEVQLPKSCTQLHFTNKNKKSNILVTHMLKVIFRVQRGDDRDLDPVTGRRKMYDIVVQTPIHILSCLCSPLYTALPPYSGDLGVMSDGPRCRCNRTNRLLSTLPSPLSPPSAGVHAPLNTPATPISANPSSQSPHAYRWPLGRHSSSQSAESTSSTEHPSGHNSPLTLSRQNSTYNRFERLVTGQETEFGEAPPAYETVVAS